MFSVAAEQSCTQNSCTSPPKVRFISPQTIIAQDAFFIIAAFFNSSPIFSIKALSSITTKAQGCLFTALGADMPALSNVIIWSFSTCLSE